MDVEYCNELECKIYYKCELKTSNHTYKVKELYETNSDKLVNFFNFKIKDYKLRKQALQFIHKNHKLPDQEIYLSLRKILHSLKKNTKRGEYRISSLTRYISDWKDIQPDFYLDIGCYQGDITKAIKDYFGLNKFQTHGIDIKKYINTDEFIYTTYNGTDIPYTDDSFSLISCLMILHHVHVNSIDKLIGEMFRVLKPGGFLIVREHNAEPQDYGLLDFLHAYYDFVLTNDTWEESKCNYHTAEFWDNKFKQAGFISFTEPKLNRNNPQNPFNNYMTSYKKPHKPTLLKNILRILPEEFPEEKYTKRSFERKNTIHWGQRKLLLSEIELFTTIYHENKHLKHLNVLYIGAAPGTHILFLAELFPNIVFTLFDPRDFSDGITTTFRPNIVVHKKKFTDKICDQFAYLNLHNLVFISDIRTADIQNMDQDEVEEHVIEDQNAQMAWVLKLKPLYSLLKFRLEWNDGVTQYLYGDIYTQPFSPHSSTETRLLVRKIDNFSMKEYNNRKYESQMFYYNKYYRNAFAELEQNIVSYDIAIEGYILKFYHDTIGTKITSDQISNSLSTFRTLNGPHPLSASKNKLVKKLITAGLIPNISYTTKEYDLYVLPIYNRINNYL